MYPALELFDSSEEAPPFQRVYSGLKRCILGCLVHVPGTAIPAATTFLQSTFQRRYPVQEVHWRRFARVRRFSRATVVGRGLFESRFQHPDSGLNLAEIV